MNVLRRPLAAALCLLAFGLLPAMARAELWRPLGPAAGQKTLDAALDPFDPAVLYALAPAGIFRSDDHGGHWRLLGAGLGYDDRGEALAVSASDPGRLLLRRDGAPLWRSADGGDHWSPVDPAGEPGLAARDVLFAPGQPSAAYAIVSRSVYRSTDGGATWTRRGGGFDGYQPDALAADPESPTILYAATSQIISSGIGGTRLDLRIFRSLDGGANWQALTAPGQIASDEPGGLGASQLVVAPGSPSAIYVPVGHSVVRSLDGGATWDLAGFGFAAGSEVERLTVDPSDPSVLYAASSSLVGPGVYETTDRGDHWTPAASGIPDGLPVHRVVIDSGDPSRLYAATDAGVFTSGDAGATWHSLASGMASEVERLTGDPHAPGAWYAITPSAALQRTTDGGATWSPFATSLDPPLRADALDVAVAPCAADTLFLSTLGTAPPGPPADLVLESTDGGASWSPAEAGLEESLQRLVVDARLCDSIFGLGAGTTFWRTDDGAATWSGVTVGHLRSLLVDPDDPSLLYAGTRSFDPDQDQGFCRSSDGGATWTCPATPFPHFAATASLAAAHGSPPTLYAAVSTSIRNAVFSSRDRGRTWRRAAGQGLPAIPGVVDLLVDRDGSTLWAATAGAGVFRSRDGGGDWTPLSRGLESLRVNQLAPGPAGLYAATAAGVFRLDEAAGAGEPPPPDDLPWIADATFPGFRFKVRIGQGSAPPISGTREAACLPETVCLSGAVPGRSELFLRIVGPKPNGWLWPTLVKFSTSEVEVWIQQLSTGRLRYYDLRGASPGVDELPGLFDRFGFLP